MCVRARLRSTRARPWRLVCPQPQKNLRFATFYVACLFGLGIVARLRWMPISRKLGSVAHRHDHHEAPPATDDSFACPLSPPAFSSSLCVHMKQWPRPSCNRSAPSKPSKHAAACSRTLYRASPVEAASYPLGPPVVIKGTRSDGSTETKGIGYEIAARAQTPARQPM